ncbi:MAG: TIGR00282 family metallophosphoesterase [Oligoflexia bacterium]|nr:TIGR00282 family metallophosphoesterase [Oligoflexia bacterium]
MPVSIICLGDVVGEPGRKALRERLSVLKQRHAADLAIVNGENVAGGLGIDVKTAEDLYSFGADILTLGDHTWHKKEFRAFLDSNQERCIRPANYPEGAPGRGWTIAKTRAGVEIGVINLIGRVFFNTPLDCPFRKAEALLDAELANVKVRCIDLHAEATSEKMAMGFYLDGRSSCVFGTHTHVQTADETILAGGTAYISDLGMCGSLDSVIGMDHQSALSRFLGGLPLNYRIGVGRRVLSGIAVTVDSTTGKALRIERIREILE